VSDFSNLYPNGLPIHNPQWNVPQPTNYEHQWLARLVELEAERDAAVKRAEAAEARYDPLETRAASILLQLDAMKQRAEAAERERDEAIADLAAVVNQLIEQTKAVSPDPNWEQTLDNL